MIVIDGTGCVLGRIASIVAKMALKGEEIHIVNAEKIVITGNRKEIIERYLHKVKRTSLTNPRRYGPYFPKMPDRIVRRTVRGMLPYKTARGREAYKRVKAYIGVPEKFEGREFVRLSEASRIGGAKQISLKELSKYLGWKGD